MQSVDQQKNQVQIVNHWQIFLQDSEDSQKNQACQPTNQQPLINQNSIQNNNADIDNLLTNNNPNNNPPPPHPHPNNQPQSQTNSEYNYNLLQIEELPQDKNFLKFILRIFLDYFKDYINQEDDKHLIDDTYAAYQNLCGSNQAHLNLTLLKYLFCQSIFNKTNRLILSQIVSKQQIIKRQIYKNGNIRHKKQYLYALKIINIRARSSMLCQRTQTR